MSCVCLVYVFGFFVGIVCLVCLVYVLDVLRILCMSSASL